MFYKKIAIFILFIIPVIIIIIPGCDSSNKITDTQTHSQHSTTELDITLAMNAGQAYIAKLPQNDRNFEIWQNAVLTSPQPYYDLANNLIAYMFAVSNNGQVVGHILVGRSHNEYNILEAGNSPPPAIPSAIDAKKIIESDLHMTIEEKYLTEPSRLVYGGHTAIAAVYDIEDKSIAISLEYSSAVLLEKKKPADSQNHRNWTTFTKEDVLAGNIDYDYYADVYAIIQDTENSLWFGTYGGGVSHYDGKNWKNFTSEDGLADNLVAAICQDSPGNLWFACDQGVTRYDGKSWRTFTIEDGLAYHLVTDIFMDSDTNLWFATYRGGLNRYDGTTWQTFTTADGLASDWCNCTAQDRQGNLWFGTQGGGVSRYDGEHWQTFTTEDGLVTPYVSDILQDTKGNLWFTTLGGASCYDGESWQSFTFMDSVNNSPLNDMNAIYEDTSGNIWIGTSGGVLRFDGNNWQTFTTEDGLVNHKVRDIVQDKEGYLWFATNGGVSRYQP